MHFDEDPGDYFEVYEEPERPPDPRQREAKEELRELFEAEREAVFYGRQLEVGLEGTYFHWITNRALRELVAEDAVKSEERELATGGKIKLYWHPSNRYNRRAAKSVTQLVEEFANPEVGHALGIQGEALTLRGFAREQFVLLGEEVSSYEGREWLETEHDLDFVFGRDDSVYGVEVKNTLGYMDYEELQAKLDMCDALGLTPVFVVRMVPKSWIYEVRTRGGFVLILKYQLYPWAHRGLARRVRETLGLPTDSPRALEDGTMQRFVRWHEQNV